MIQFLAMAGRALMGGGRAAAGGASKAATGAGPRGANELVEGGSKAAGKSSPMDMLGNVANVAMIGSMIPGLMPGGGEKPKEGQGGKQGGHYESVLN